MIIACHRFELKEKCNTPLSSIFAAFREETKEMVISPALVKHIIKTISESYFVQLSTLWYNDCHRRGHLLSRMREKALESYHIKLSDQISHEI